MKAKSNCRVNKLIILKDDFCPNFQIRRKIKKRFLNFPFVRKQDLRIKKKSPDQVLWYCGADALLHVDEICDKASHLFINNPHLLNQSTQTDPQPVATDDSVARAILQCCGHSAVDAYNQGQLYCLGDSHIDQH